MLPRVCSGGDDLGSSKRRPDDSASSRTVDQVQCVHAVVRTFNVHLPVAKATYLGRYLLTYGYLGR